MYLRVSTVLQAEGFSLLTQREASEALAHDRGAVVVGILEDTFTGTSLDRPAMNALRDMVARGEVDIVIAYDPDRISRNLYDLLIITSELDKAGVDLAFVNFQWQNSPEGLLFLQLRGAIAQFEHALIRERTVRGRRKKAASGQLEAFYEPYGYRFDPEGDRVLVDPQTAPVVQEIFAWYVHEDLSLREIAARLNHRGMPPPLGTRWHPGTLWRILRRRAYTGALVRRARGQGAPPLAIAPLVSRELFEAAQRGDRRRGRRSLEGPALPVVCGCCGERLRRVRHRVKGRAFDYYVCRRREQKTCGEPYHREERLHEAVLGSLHGRLAAEGERLRLAWEGIQRQGESHHLTRQLATVAASLGRLREAEILGQVDGERAGALRCGLAAERDRLMARMDALTVPWPGLPQEPEAMWPLVERVEVRGEDVTVWAYLP